MAETKHQKVRLRPFAGMINRANEVLVPVYFASHEEGFMWLPVPKSTAKEIIEHAQEHGIEEIEGVTEEDGCLYIDGPDGDEEPGGEEEEEEETTTE